jgi:glycosyltransferase involved in cell wall biosynthesis
MKILFAVHQFYPYHYSGTERVVFTTAKQLQKMGHSCTVISYCFHLSTNPRRHDEIQWEIIDYENLKIINYHFTTPRPDISGVIYQENQKRFFDEILKMVKPDLVHVAHCMHVGTICWSAIDTKIPYVLNLTDFWLLCHKATMQFSDNELCSSNEKGMKCKKYCGGLEPNYYEERFRQAQYVLTNSRASFIASDWLHAVFEKNVHVEISPVFVPYGVDRSYLGFNMKHYNSGQKKPIIFLFSGTLVHHKGISVLCNAIKKCHANNVEFHIYGEGPLQPAIEALAIDDPRVKFLGTYDKKQTNQILSNADVGLVPSTWYENSPIILQEMLAMNLPVIATNAGCLPEQVQPGLNGFLIEIGDDKQLAKLFELIAQNPTILNPLKTHVDAGRIYTVEQSAYMVEIVYKKIFLEIK